MAKVYSVLKRIRYKGPGPMYRALVEPGSDEAKKGLDFSHLSDYERGLLQKIGILGKEIKVNQKKESQLSDKS